MATVLIVDDDWRATEILSGILKRAVGCRTITAGNGEAALRKVRKHSPDLMILDLMLPGMQGKEVLRKARAIKPDLVVVILTAFGGSAVGLEMAREGAAAIIDKGKNAIREVVDVVKKLLDDRAREIEETAGASMEEELTALWWKGKSRAIASSLEQVDSAARTGADVLVEGEYGTCKKAVALMIHRHSPRRNGPFVVLDCRDLPAENAEVLLFGREKGAFPPADERKAGALEQAGGGTLILHHISELKPAIQPMLIGVLEKKAFRPPGALRDVRMNARIVATSTLDLSSLAARGLFRKELRAHFEYSRIRTPALRDRKEDVPLLSEELLAGANIRHGKKVRDFSVRAMRELSLRAWPENLVELWSAIDGAVMMNRTGSIFSSDLRGIPAPALVQALSTGGSAVEKDVPLRDKMQSVERDTIRNALEMTGGMMSKAARILALPKSTLSRKMKKLGLP